MSCCNVLQRVGSNFCVNDNFVGIFIDFCFKDLRKKEIAPMLIHVAQILNCKGLSNAVVKVPRDCCERTLT